MTKPIKPPLSIEAFNIQNFKGIKSLEIENLTKGARWIFLTGENGFGKTSILQGVATALVGEEEHNFNHFNSVKDITLHIKLHGQKDYTGLNENKWNILYSPINNPPLVCYGASRLDVEKEKSSKSNSENITRNLWDTQTLLENIENQFSRWYFKKEDKEFKARYEGVYHLLKDLLGLYEIEVDYRTDRVYYIEQDINGEAHEHMTLNQIASGYRSIISMVGDMILRLSRSQPKVYNPTELEGIAIIDELDLHFHPKWQKKLPGLLSKCFPKVQFFVSTHSPIPLLGAPADSVFLTVDRTVEKGITIERLVHLEKEINKLTPNLILNSPVFGFAEIYAKNYRSATLKTEDTHQEKEFDEQLKRKLNKGLSPNKQQELESLLKSLEE